MTDSTGPASAHDVLAGLPLFAGLSSRQLGRLIKTAKETRHQAGRVVATEGAGSLAMHVLLEGTATVSVGGQQVRELGVGDYFGEISMIDGKPRSATVEAATDLRTLAVSHLDFTSLLSSDADFAGALLVALCARLREAEARSA